MTAILAALAATLPACSPATTAQSAPPAPRADEGQFALTSSRIALPADESALPVGPGADLVNRNCLACHSAGMILTQPRFSEKQWTAIVEKMRSTYKAPIDDAEIPEMVGYLGNLPD